MYLSSEKRRVTLVVYLPLSGAVEVPEIVSEELVFVRACLLHLDSAAKARSVSILAVTSRGFGQSYTTCRMPASLGRLKI